MKLVPRFGMRTKFPAMTKQVMLVVMVKLRYLLSKRVNLEMGMKYSSIHIYVYIYKPICIHILHA